MACILPAASPPWTTIQQLFALLDPDTIQQVNSCYDERKIIKSPMPGQGVEVDR